MKTKEISLANGANLRKYSPSETPRRRDIQVGQASRLPSRHGKDGLLQPSLAPSPTWASRRSAPTPPLRASALRASALRSRLAFTLLEVLVATAVLALIMTFLFNLLGSSAKLWEIGNKKIEGAQAARIGLNIMADELKNAFAGNMTTYPTNGLSTFNVAPFLATQNPIWGGNPTVNAENAAGSQRIAFVNFDGNANGPYQEVQYQSIYFNSPFRDLAGNRYCLVRGYQNYGHRGDFYFRGSVNTTWERGGTSFELEPITDNCIRLKLEYYGNELSPTGAPGWTSNGSWTPRDRLPLGVLVTLTVLDSKTAEKIAAIKGTSPLTQLEIDNGLSSSPSATSTPVERLIAQGSVTMSRFIPFNSN